MQLPLYISYSLLLVTVVLSFVFYKKYKNSQLKIFPYILSLALATEIIAWFLRTNGHYNVWLYNQYVNIEYLFYLYLFYKYLTNTTYKKIILIGTIVYEMYFIINYAFFSDGNLNKYQTYPFAFAQILIIIVLFTFVIEMLSSDKILHIQKYLIFWVAVGLLFYYIVPLPLNVSESILHKKELSHKTISFLRQIQHIGNIIMYLLFIYGFIWSSKTYKELS